MRFSVVALFLLMVPAAVAQRNQFQPSLGQDPVFVWNWNGPPAANLVPRVDRCAIRLVEVPVPDIDRKAIIKPPRDVDKSMVVEPLIPACPRDTGDAPTTSSPRRPNLRSPFPIPR